MSTPARIALVAAVLVVAAMPTGAEQRTVRRELLIAAAASLNGLAAPLARAVHDQHGLDARFTFAGSNTLARQIVEGARIDVFISADEAQMDVVERAGLLVPGTRVDVLSNQLVVIVPRGTASRVDSPDALARHDVRRVAMGDPDAVPAGVYGRRWLESLRLWPAVQPKVVRLPSSRAAVAAVREGRADAGVVYLTDAAAGDASATVAIAHTVNPADGPAIRYPAAAIARGRLDEARTFLAFLQSAAATSMIEAAGFRRPPAR